MRKNKMSKEELMENLFDELINEASVKASEKLGEQYLAEYDDGVEVEFSEEYKAGKAKMLKEYNRKTAIKKSLKISSRIAIIVLCISILSGGIAVVSVDALRIKVFNMVIEIFHTYSKMNSNKNEGYRFSNDDITLEYVPNGFEIETNTKFDDRISLRFSENDRFFNVSVIIYEEDGDNNINTQETEIIEIDINGYDGSFISNNGINILTWHDDDYTYKFSGNMERNELKKIAENARK